MKTFVIIYDYVVSTIKLSIYTFTFVENYQKNLTEKIHKHQSGYINGLKINIMIRL